MQNNEDKKYKVLLNEFEKVRFENLPGYPIIPGMIHIFRALPLYKEAFNNFKDLSYNPHPKDYGRVHTPKDPIFYGSISTSNNDYPLITNFAESIEQLRTSSKGSSEEHELIIGRWGIKEQFNVLAIIFNLDFLQKNKQYLPLFKDYLTVTLENRKKDFQLLSYISDEFASSNPKSYLTTASFSQSILKRNSNLGGIIYPSVRLAGEGTNIAIRKSAADKNLQLEKVVITKVYIENERVINEYLKHGFEVDSYGNFELQEITDKTLRPGKEACLKKLRENE